MEREGGKDEKERRIIRMQRPANTFFPKLKDTHTSRMNNSQNTQNSEKIEQVVARSTPVKRKCNLWTDLGNKSDLSTIGSPAKRRKENFNCLLKYWDSGGGVRGQALEIKNEPFEPIINITKNSNIESDGTNAQSRKTTKSKSESETHSGEGERVAKEV